MEQVDINRQFSSHSLWVIHSLRKVSDWGCRMGIKSFQDSLLIGSTKSFWISEMSSFLFNYIFREFLKKINRNCLKIYFILELNTKVCTDWHFNAMFVFLEISSLWCVTLKEGSGAARRATETLTLVWKT